jgi:Flp pilus assembly protein TadG
MRISLRHFVRDERGMSLVFVCVGFMAMLSATTIAIDVGMFMTARSQAQNAADAGAHAGAVALVFNSNTDRTATGPAVMSAVNAAAANQVMGATVSVTPADVTFPLDPNGVANRVQVVVYRTTLRGNPVDTLMGTFFGVANVDISATATAEASAANAMSCVKPFMIPDRWKENNTPANGTFDEFDNKGACCPTPDTTAGSRPYPIPIRTTPATRPRKTSARSSRFRAGPATNIIPSFTTRGRCRETPAAISTARTSQLQPERHRPGDEDHPGTRRQERPDHSGHSEADRQGTRARIGTPVASA